MVSKQTLLIGAGASALGATGLAVYFSSDKSSNKGSEAAASEPSSVGCAGKLLGEFKLEDIKTEVEGEKEALKTEIKDIKEIQPTDACFSFSGVTYSSEDNKKLESGKFEFVAVKQEDSQNTGAFVTANVSKQDASIKLVGTVVSLSKGKDDSSWKIDKGFGFSVENFNKELKSNDVTGDNGSLNWKSSTDGSIFDLVKESDSGYKPLLGSGIKNINEVKITSVYVSSDSKWKSVKGEDSDDIKNEIKDLISAETKGKWESATSTPAAAA